MSEHIHIKVVGRACNNIRPIQICDPLIYWQSRLERHCGTKTQPSHMVQAGLYITNIQRPSSEVLGPRGCSWTHTTLSGQSGQTAVLHTKQNNPITKQNRFSIFTQEPSGPMLQWYLIVVKKWTERQWWNLPLIRYGMLHVDIYYSLALQFVSFKFRRVLLQ